jgi:signal transduction histidine kinase
MLAMVAHDLRDPLHTIAVGLETLLKLQPSDDERAARQIVVMQRTVRSMDRMILDLLDVTRIEGGNFVLAREHVQVRPLLGEVLELFEAPAQQRGISLTCHAPECVPCVIGERDRLIQVLSNLIGNAVKFTRPRGRISVHAQLREEALHFTVEDTVPGFRAKAFRICSIAFGRPTAREGTGPGSGCPSRRRSWKHTAVGSGLKAYWVGGRHFILPFPVQPPRS